MVQPRGAAEGVTEGVPVGNGDGLAVEVAEAAAPVEGDGEGEALALLPPTKAGHATARMRLLAASATRNTPLALSAVMPEGLLKRAYGPAPSANPLCAAATPPPARAVGSPTAPLVAASRRRSLCDPPSATMSRPAAPPTHERKEGMKRQALAGYMLPCAPQPATVDTAPLG